MAQNITMKTINQSSSSQFFIKFSRNCLHIYGLTYKKYVKRKVGIKYGNKKGQQFQKNYWPELMCFGDELVKREYDISKNKCQAIVFCGKLYRHKCPARPEPSGAEYPVFFRTDCVHRVLQSAGVDRSNAQWNLCILSIHLFRHVRQIVPHDGIGGHRECEYHCRAG